MRWVKFSAGISHRATDFPQAAFRAVGSWKCSVVVTVRKRPAAAAAATVRSHVGGATTCHLKLQTFALFLSVEKKEMVSSLCRISGVEAPSDTLMMICGTLWLWVHVSFSALTRRCR